MSSSKLPERASLEYLKKIAKDRLRELRKSDPLATLTAVQLAVAREHGFTSWRALKAEVEQRQSGNLNLFFEACDKGDVRELRKLLKAQPSLVKATRPDAQYGGWTGLHVVAQRGHLNAVRLLLQHGADPNAREAGDNTYPLHWAAARRDVEIVRALLDAGGDVHGVGDDHELDAIGWASFFHPDDGKPGEKPEVASLLVERGARHHIFSAISMGDLDEIRKLVEQSPKALDRRTSRFENRLTPLHFSINQKRYDILDLLIQLGADLEAVDGNGHTALATAMLNGDQEAMRLLQAAGAKPPKAIHTSDFRESMRKLGKSVKKCTPMIFVQDVAESLDWYTSIGFTEVARYGDAGKVNFGVVSFGEAVLFLNMNGKAGPHDVTLWFGTNKVDRLYRLLKSRQIEAAQAALANQSGNYKNIEFQQHLYEPFYGGREFAIRDPNGYVLYFRQDKLIKSSP